jgi:hypothetical protein
MSKSEREGVLEVEPEPPLGGIQTLFWLFLLFPLPLEWLLLLELGAESDEVPLQEEPEQAGGGTIEEYNAVAAVVLDTLSRRISSEINMEHTLTKDGRVANMVMLDVA